MARGQFGVRWLHPFRLAVRQRRVSALTPHFSALATPMSEDMSPSIAGWPRICTRTGLPRLVLSRTDHTGSTDSRETPAPPRHLPLGTNHTSRHGASTPLLKPLSGFGIRKSGGPLCIRFCTSMGGNIAAATFGTRVSATSQATPTQRLSGSFR